MNQYLLTFAPTLALDPEDFVTTWNQLPACRQIGTATLEERQATQFDPLTSTAVAILTGLASAALYDGIKYVIKKRIAPSEESLLQRL